MHTNFIKSVYKTLFGGVSSPTFKFGNFSIVNSTTAHIAALGSQFAASLRMTSKFQATQWDVHVVHTDPETDNTGINKKFINDGGGYNILAAVDEFQRYAPGTRLASTDMAALVVSSITNDSQEAFLYNMLVSWLFAVIAQDSGTSESGIFKLIKHVYNDSHVTVEENGLTIMQTEDVQLGPPVDTLDDFGANVRSRTVYWERPYVVRIPATSRSQAGFYMYHMAGRIKRTNMTADFNIPSVKSSETSIEYIGGESGVFDFENIPWEKADTLWVWIKDYVVMNRLETAFAGAMDLLGALAFHPHESFQESHMWKDGKLTVNLARFTPTRARVPANLEGEPYRTENTYNDFVMSDGANPRQYLVTSAVMNYAMWHGLYSIIDNAISGMSNWRAALQSRENGMEALYSVDMRADILSVIFGKEIETVTSPNAYVTYDPNGIADRKSIQYHDTADGYPRVVTNDRLFQYVSGSLLCGTLAGTLRADQHLMANQTVKFNDDCTLDSESAVKLANIYRLFGYDTTLAHYRTHEEYRTYANAHEAVISTEPMFTDVDYYRDLVTVVSCEKRTGRSENMIDVTAIMFGKSLEVLFTQPVLSVTEWGSSVRKVQPTLMLPSRARAVHFKVKGRKVMHEVKMPMRELAPPRTDFQRVQTEVAPQNPVVNAVGVIDGQQAMAAVEELLAPPAE
uniref:Coat protein n=1 Tax=Diaporthe helianthi totivirus 2 TaxID=3077437 RepID=A0AA96KG14_9VIRU|nr:MAG: coat protein [Diaporthe helianthi totivirus 2]